MLIETDRYIIRHWRLTDAESLARNANNIKISKFLRDGFPNPYGIEDALNWIKMVFNAGPNMHAFAIVVDGNAVGSIGITFKEDVYRLNAEIGYFIGEDYWSQGIMSSVVKEVVDYIFTNHDTVRIFAEVFETNKASVKVLEKAGFIQEAVFKKNIVKDNKLLNSFLYSILKSGI